MDDIIVTQEPAVEAEANQGEKEEVDIHVPMVDIVVTQEPTVETEAN